MQPLLALSVAVPRAYVALWTLRILVWKRSNQPLDACAAPQRHGSARSAWTLAEYWFGNGPMEGHAQRPDAMAGRVACVPTSWVLVWRAPAANTWGRRLGCSMTKNTVKKSGLGAGSGLATGFGSLGSQGAKDLDVLRRRTGGEERKVCDAQKNILLELWNLYRTIFRYICQSVY